jgi:hypothetical protein
VLDRRASSRPHLSRSTCPAAGRAPQRGRPRRPWDTFEPSPTWEPPDRAQSPNTEARAKAPPHPTSHAAGVKPPRSTHGNHVSVEPPSSRLGRGKAGRWRPSRPIPSPNGGAAKQGVASADGCMHCPSATTGRRRGPFPRGDPGKPAPFWAELSETSPSSRVPVQMAEESFCRELEATVLGELNGGGSAGGR